MAGTDTAMVYRIGANLDELRKNLSEGKAIINAVNADVVKMTGQAVPFVERTRDGLGNIKPKVDDLHQSFQKFDNLLGALGVNIGQDVKGLQELAVAAKQGGDGMSLLSTAGLAVGAAIGGWKIGRWIADLGDFDKTIGDATAKLLGFGDVAGEEAAAKADVLARASKIAGMEIKSFTLAMAINEDAAKSHAESINTSANRVAGWNAEIAKVKANGQFGLLTDDLKSQNFELKELSERYHISVDALKFYTNETEKAEQAIADANKKKLDQLREDLRISKEQREKAEQLFEATTHLQFAQGNYTDVLAKTDAKLVESIQHYKELGLSAADTATILQVSQSRVELVSTALDHQNDSLNNAHKQWQALEQAQRESLDKMVENAQSAAAAQAKAFNDAVAAIEESQHRMSGGGAHTYDLSTDEGMAEFKRLNPSATINADKNYFKTHTLQDAIAAGLVDLYAGFKHKFAGGVQNFGGGMALVGERGPELVRLPGGSDVIPNHQLGGASVTTHIYVSGAIVGTQDQLAALIDKALIARLKNAGLRVPVGA